MIFLEIAILKEIGMIFSENLFFTFLEKKNKKIKKHKKKFKRD